MAPSFYIHRTVCKTILILTRNREKISNVNKFILLYAKKYIYCFRCNTRSFMLAIFKEKNIYFMYQMHMELAYANNNLDNFQNELRPYEDLLNDINTYFKISY